MQRFSCERQWRLSPPKMTEHFYDRDSEQINVVFIYPIHTAVQKTKAVRTLSLKEARTFHSG